MNTFSLKRLVGPIGALAVTGALLTQTSPVHAAESQSVVAPSLHRVQPEWWSEIGQAAASGAVSGAVGGAVSGAFACGAAGAASGALTGGLAGGLAGAVTTALSSNRTMIVKAHAGSLD